MRTLYLTLILTISLSFGSAAQGFLKPYTAQATDSLLSYNQNLASTQPRQTLGIAQKLQKEALREGDSLHYASAILLEGASRFYLKEINLALALNNEALSIFQNYRNNSGLAQSYFQIGIIDALNGNTYEALIKLEKSLSLGRGDSNKTMEASALIQIAGINLKQNELDLAWNRTTKALKIAESKDLTQLQVQANNLLGNILISAQKPIDAELMLEKARSIALQLQDSIGLSHAYAGLATAWLARGNKLAAQDFIERALKISKTYGIPCDYPEDMLIASQIYLTQGATAKSLEMAKMAEQLTRQTLSGMPPLLREVAHQLSDVYLVAGDSSKAFVYFSLYSRLRDSLAQDDINKFVLQPQSKVAREDTSTLAAKPVRQISHSPIVITDRGSLIILGLLILLCAILTIALIGRRKSKKSDPDLSEKIREKDALIQEKQKLADERLQELQESTRHYEEMDKTKNKVFSVLTHDLRQPINQIKSVLELLEMEELEGKDRMEIVEKLKESIDNSSNALENLLLWSKKQLTGISTTIVDVHLLPQVWQLESHMKPSLDGKNLKLEINVPDFFKIKADMNQLDICLRNLLTNAIKFSNRGGTITIDALEENGRKIVRIIDNGVGMTPEQLEKLRGLKENFSTLGTMNEKGTGLGILITREFMQNQNGDLEIISRKGEGSIFSMIFNDSIPTNHHSASQSQQV